MKKPWKKNLALSQVSLTLKSFGLQVEKNKFHMIEADLMAFWDRTNKHYMFLIKDVFTLTDTSDAKFKEVVSFCKVNSFKLIVITTTDDDELAGFTEDIRSITSLGFKVLRFEQMKEFYKGVLKFN
jgi:hypothetical protein